MKLLSRLFIVLLFFSIALPVHAMTTMGGQSVLIPQDQEIQGTLFAGGTTVTVDGTVNGDLFCGGQTVVISGVVNGDVICGGQTVRIEGTVSGSLRAGGQFIDLTGSVGRNITAAGQSLRIDKDATVSGEAIFAGQTLVNNSGLTNISFFEGDNKEMKKPAVVVTKTPKSPITLLWKMIAYMVFAGIILLIAPKKTAVVLGFMKKEPGRSMLSGLLVLIVVPLIAIVLTITIIGIPFALVLILLYILALLTARVLTAVLVGQYLVGRFKTKHEQSMLLPVIVGVFVSWLIFGIPIAGGLASCVAVIWGLGGIVKSRKK